MEKGNDVPKFKYSATNRFNETDVETSQPETKTVDIPEKKEPEKKAYEVTPARHKSSLLVGTYKVNMQGVSMRTVPGSSSPSTLIKTLNSGDTVTTDGYFTMSDSKKWLLVKDEEDTGYVIIDYLKKKR